MVKVDKNLVVEKKVKKENTQHVDLHLQDVKIKVKEKNGVNENETN